MSSWIICRTLAFFVLSVRREIAAPCAPGSGRPCFCFSTSKLQTSSLVWLATAARDMRSRAPFTRRGHGGEPGEPRCTTQRASLGATRRRRSTRLARTPKKRNIGAPGPRRRVETEQCEVTAKRRVCRDAGGIGGFSGYQSFSGSRKLPGPWFSRVGTWASSLRSTPESCRRQASRIRYMRRKVAMP